MAGPSPGASRRAEPGRAGLMRTAIDCFARYGYAGTSIERIARGADEARYRRRDAVLPLWETHLLAGRLVSAVIRRPLTVLE